MNIELLITLYLIVGVGINAYIFIADRVAAKTLPTEQLIYTCIFVELMWPIVVLADTGSKFCRWMDKKRGIT